MPTLLDRTPSSSGAEPIGAGGAVDVLDEEVFERVAHRVDRHQTAAPPASSRASAIGSAAGGSLDHEATRRRGCVTVRSARLRRGAWARPSTTISHPLNVVVDAARRASPRRPAGPSTTIATRLQSVSASGRMCELKKTVRPSSRSRRIRARTSRRPSGSSPDIGSSRKTTSGSLISACASPTRWIMPFENLRSCIRRSAPSPTSSSRRGHARRARRRRGSRRGRRSSSSSSSAVR